MFQVACITRQRSQYSVHPAVEHGIQVDQFLVHRFPGLADDQIEPFLIDPFLDPCHHRRLKIAIQPGEDHPDGVGTIFTQVAGKRIVLVAHILSGFLDSPHRFFSDGRMIPESPADG